MRLIKWIEKKSKGLTIWDIGCIKWSSLLVGIILGAYIADFTKKYLWVFIIVAALLIIKVLLKIFKK